MRLPIPLAVCLGTVLLEASAVPSSGRVLPAIAVERIVYLDTISANNPGRLDQLRRELAQYPACRSAVIDYLPIQLGNEAIPAESLGRIQDRPQTVILASSAAFAKEALAKLRQARLVFQTHMDPVPLGLVDSVNQPGPRATGVSYYAPLMGKHLELLKTGLPDIKVVGVIADRKTLAHPLLQRELKEASAALALKLVNLPADTLAQAEAQIDAARIDALYIPLSTLGYLWHQPIAQRAAHRNLPSMLFRSIPAGHAGTFGYLPASIDGFAKMVKSIGLLCAGVPTDLIPVDRVRHFTFYLNLKESRRMGLKLDANFVRLADQVIQ